MSALEGLSVFGPILVDNGFAGGFGGFLVESAELFGSTEPRPTQPSGNPTLFRGKLFCNMHLPLTAKCDTILLE
jgi:hypothetical protein